MLLVAWLNIDLLIIMNLDLPQVFLAAKMLKAEHFSRSCPPIGCQAMLSITRHRLTRGVSRTLGIHNWCPYRPLLATTEKTLKKNSHNAARQEANLNWSQKCTTAQMRIPGIVKNSSEFFYFSWIFECFIAVEIWTALYAAAFLQSAFCRPYFHMKYGGRVIISGLS